MPKTQTEFEQTKGPSIEAVEEAAATYVVKRDTRMKLTKEEKEAKGHLLHMLAEHEGELVKDADGNVSYSYYDGEREMEVVRKTSVEVSVRVKKTADDEDNVVDLDEARKGDEEIG